MLSEILLFYLIFVQWDCSLVADILLDESPGEKENLIVEGNRSQLQGEIYEIHKQGITSG